MIGSFRGQNYFLSNFANCYIKVNGIDFTSVESAFQACKAVRTSDFLKFQNMTPSEAKKAGRYIELRPDWEDVKLNLMLGLTRHKFQDPELAQMLLDTGDEELVEGNNWGDTYWGVCKGVGENHLGKILMRVRDELRRED